MSLLLKPCVMEEEGRRESSRMPWYPFQVYLTVRMRILMCVKMMAIHFCKVHKYFQHVLCCSTELPVLDLTSHPLVHQYCY